MGRSAPAGHEKRRSKPLAEMLGRRPKSWPPQSENKSAIRSRFFGRRGGIVPAPLGELEYYARVTASFRFQ